MSTAYCYDLIFFKIYIYPVGLNNPIQLTYTSHNQFLLHFTHSLLQMHNSIYTHIACTLVTRPPPFFVSVCVQSNSQKQESGRYTERKLKKSGRFGNEATQHVFTPAHVQQTHKHITKSITQHIIMVNTPHVQQTYKHKSTCTLVMRGLSKV